MADHECRDLRVPDRVGAKDRVVDRRLGGAEDVGAVAERVGDQKEARLPLEDEKREVMRNDIGERDRDQRVGEAAGQLRRRRLAGACAVHSDDGEPVEPAYEPHKQQQPNRVGGLDRRSCRKAERSEQVTQLLGHPARSRPHRPLRETIEAGRPDQNTDDGYRTGSLRHLECPNKRCAQAAATAVPVERRKQREEAEGNAEAVCVAAPFLGTEAAHPNQHHGGVDQRHDRKRAWLLAPAPDQLNPGEAENHQGGRPASKTLRVADRRRQPAANARCRPADATADCAPRA
ncbi:unannotated protein [freshwater metagenome]|uniref:Unannotated protein n=1 Tax=freshwater metagenome TaxID=449393 RepID=A0A6J5ZX54_9ZZZZ